jgi:EAL domain-containing protein (putative c-di-GMP-specific phosphodiesterase class I)
MPTATPETDADLPPVPRAAAALGRDLDAALARGELRVVYQPIVALADGRVLGAEALLRWTHPTRGEVLPTAFVAAAERSGAIVAIGRFVLWTACRDAAAWRHATGDAPFVTVNVSHRQLLDTAFQDDVRDALRDAGLPPAALTLKLVETRARASVATLARALDAVRATGVRVAFDDFGTGFAALGDLARLPVDVLKLPRPLRGLAPGRRHRRAGHPRSRGRSASTWSRKASRMPRRRPGCARSGARARRGSCSPARCPRTGWRSRCASARSPAPDARPGRQRFAPWVRT